MGYGAIGTTTGIWDGKSWAESMGSVSAGTFLQASEEK